MKVVSDFSAPCALFLNVSLQILMIALSIKSLGLNEILVASSLLIHAYVLKGELYVK
jgi:hypothetical protein